MKTMTDAELLEAYSTRSDRGSGDSLGEPIPYSAGDAAFCELMRRHRALVYRTCLRLLKDHHEAEDAVQAVFVVLAEHAAGLRKGDLSAWLYQVSHNVAAKAVRMRIRRTHREQRHAEERASQMNGSTAEKITDPAALELLDMALIGLPDRYREAVVLRYLKNHSQEEAARLAGCPLGTLKWRASKGIELLRQQLAKRGVTTSSSALIGLLFSEASATVPEMLLSSMLATVNLAVAPSATATSAASNLSAAAPGASEGVMTLAKGAMKAMFFAKVKWVAMLCTAALVVAAAVPSGWRLISDVAGDQGDENVSEAKAEPSEEDLRRKGLVAIAVAQGPPLIVPVTDPLGRCKMWGASLRTFVELAQKLDDARVEGDTLCIPSWTAKDDRRLAYALIDVCSDLLWRETARLRPEKDEVLATWKRAAECHDPDVRAGVVSLIFDKYKEPSVTTDALLRKGLTDKDPLTRACIWVCCINDYDWGELVEDYHVGDLKNLEPCERFATALGAASYLHPSRLPQMEVLQKLSDDPCVVVRGLCQAAQLDHDLRQPRWIDFQAKVGPALARARKDANPLLRTLLPSVLSMIQLEASRGRQQAPVDLSALVGGEDGWAALCRGYLQCLDAFFGEPSADGLKSAVDASERLLQDKHLSHQLLSVLPIRFCFIPVAAKQAVQPPPAQPDGMQALRRLDGKKTQVTDVLRERCTAHGAPLIRRETVEATLNSENPWVRAVGLGFGCFSDTLQAALPGLLDDATIKGSKRAFHQALVSPEELERAPALIAAWLRSGALGSGRTAAITPEIHHAFKRVWSSPRLGENLLASQSLVQVLPFEEALAILQQRFRTDERSLDAMVWLVCVQRKWLGHYPFVESKEGWPNRFAKICEIVPVSHLPVLGRAMPNGRIEEMADHVRLIENVSPALLASLPFFKLYQPDPDEAPVFSALLRRATTLADSSEVADRKYASVLVRKPYLIDGGCYFRDKTQSEAWQHTVDTLLNNQILNADKPSAEAIMLLASALEYFCSSSHRFEAGNKLPRIWCDAIQKTVTLAKDPAYQSVLLQLLQALDKRIYSGHTHPDTATIQRFKEELTKALSAAESAEVRSRVQMILARNDREWAARLAHSLMSGEVPAPLFRKALTSTADQVARLSPAYHEFLFEQFTGGAKQDVASSLLCEVPGLEDRLVTRAFAMVANGEETRGFNVLEHLLSGQKRRLDAQKPGEDAATDLEGPRPAWIIRIRDHVLPQLKQGLALLGGMRIGVPVRLLAECGPDPEVERVFIDVIRNPQLQNVLQYTHSGPLAVSTAESLHQVAPLSSYYALLLKDGYDTLSPEVRCALALSAARSPGAEKAAKFLAKVLSDNAVIGHLTNHSFLLSRFSVTLQSWAADPELVAALKALKRNPAFEYHMDEALKKLGHAPAFRPPAFPPQADLAERLEKLQRTQGALPRLEALTLDGKLVEWGAAVAVPLRYASYIAHLDEFHEWNGPADCGAELLCGWNRDGLCLAGFVADDDLRNDRPPENSFEQDCVEIFVDGRIGKRFMRPPYTKGAYQIFVRPPIGGKGASLGFNQEYGAVPGARVAGTPVEGGWAFELIIPWKAFPEYEPRVGSMLGLQFALDDADARDAGLEQPLMMSWQAATKLYKSPEKMVKWELAEELPRGAEARLGMAVGIDLPLVIDEGDSVKVAVELGRSLALQVGAGRCEVKTLEGVMVAHGDLTFAKLAPPWQDSAGCVFEWKLGGTPDGIYVFQANFKDAKGAELGVASRHMMLQRGAPAGNVPPNPGAGSEPPSESDAQDEF